MAELKACVLGAGTIGLPVAAMMAKSGITTSAYDTDERVVSIIKKGEFTNAEPYLHDAIQRGLVTGRLAITGDIDSAMKNVDVAVICVPTPLTKNMRPDYSAISSCCQTISPYLRKGTLVICESTVGIGTVESLVRPILEAGSKMKAGYEGFLLAACPERVNPGSIIENLETVPRIVGGIDKKSTDAAATFYHTLYGVPIIKVSNPRTANAVKIMENVFRDVNIALANELAIFFNKNKYELDLIEVIKAAKTKWNFVAHYPGPGVGGPCIPVTPYYLLTDGTKKTQSLPPLIKTARRINNRMFSYVVSMVSGCIDRNRLLRNDCGKICVLGLSYKPNVKDTKNSPSKFIVRDLYKLTRNLSIYDPFFKGEQFLGLEVERNLRDAIRDAECLLILTAHDEFKDKQFVKTLKLLHPNATVIDAVHVLDPHEVVKNNLYYKGLAKPDSAL